MSSHRPPINSPTSRPYAEVRDEDWPPLTNNHQHLIPVNVPPVILRVTDGKANFRQMDMTELKTIVQDIICQLPIANTPTIEAIGISIHTKGLGVVDIIIFAYCPQGNCTTEEINKLFDRNNHFIVGGDFNAHHGMWSHLTPNLSGKSIHSTLMMSPTATLITPHSPEPYVHPSTDPIIPAPKWILNDDHWHEWNAAIASKLNNEKFIELETPQESYDLFYNTILTENAMELHQSYDRPEFQQFSNRARPIQIIECRSTDSKEKANLLIETLLGEENVSPTTNRDTDIAITAALESEEGSSLNSPITTEEINKALTKLKSNATGPDTIHNKMLANISLTNREFLRHLFNILLFHERTAKVRVKNQFSDANTLTKGVPQGAVLSPTLFNVMMSDLPNPPRSITQHTPMTLQSTLKQKPHTKPKNPSNLTSTNFTNTAPIPTHWQPCTKLFLRSKIDYGIIAYGGASASNLSKIDVATRSIFRLILGSIKNQRKYSTQISG
ncbi:hypothetical protein OUZ56_010009 [Daphnia magna]|uniref:Endonuclease/exonuclease/phosphatase domain-containing protein n=1 Tax=Daphnia magna TaxID=35525 RepID=A0ABR0AHJ4_9CRUS|nr:hypothetical protein OUZ56_010009 [Daphnia magna]